MPEKETIERARRDGADATVQLDGDDLASRLRDACGGDGPTVVLDPLWGEIAAAAAEAAAPLARLVHFGQSAGASAPLASSAVRGKELTIVGVSNFRRSADELHAVYHELLSHVVAGRIRLDLETFPLAQVGEAWRRQGAGAKAVVTVSA